MKEIQFLVEIHAPKEKVWDTLWQDQTLREWAGIIDPGTYMSGELKEGKEVQFISSENGYGVTSLVERLVAHEFLLLRHQADTQGSGEKERAQEWTGGKESYSLVEKDGTTTLTAVFDVPSEMEEYFKDTYPKALERVKVLAEKDK
ncbi:MAG TPA: SRPBCC domain-containing protein [Verrucomicrobiae bacterium]|nr:SRPBCC domain-containing protein [Verrucomicrobiae bacterium]